VIRVIVNDVLAALHGEFEKLYEGTGRQSVALERLLRASLLQAFYSVRSERQLMEQIDYNLLFRWFVGLGIDDPVWDHSTFSKNRDRLLDADVARKFLEAVLRHAQVKRFLSDDHFSVDWHADRGMGEPEEHPSQGWQRPSRRRRGATVSAISTAKPAATTRMRAPLTQKQNFTGKAMVTRGHALIENRQPCGSG
jgi:transposase